MTAIATAGRWWFAWECKHHQVTQAKRLLAQLPTPRLHINAYEVGLTDRGDVFAIRLRELRGVTVSCSSCAGDGEVECLECDGEGERECDMGHVHDCVECDGAGRAGCVRCMGLGSLELPR